MYWGGEGKKTLLDDNLNVLPEVIKDFSWDFNSEKQRDDHAIKRREST